MNDEIESRLRRVAVDRYSCTGCGTCAGICPSWAIEMSIDRIAGVYVPAIDDSKCTDCGTCSKVCTAHHIDLRELNSRILGRDPKNEFIGHFENCYFGHATDDDIRRNSASGGLVTSLLVYELERGHIDGALVTKMAEDDPLRTESFIARTVDEIIDASKSKYCPVPANVAIRKILKADGRIAVVGLPCHIHGIRMAELVDERLRQKIVLHLGIFCSHTLNFIGTEFLLSRLGIRPDDSARISYRARGWPGGIEIILKDGEAKFVSNDSPLWGAIFGSFFFTPYRCLFCPDVTAELADISFGDPWLPEFTANERIGMSLIISRTEIGEELLRDAVDHGTIYLKAAIAENVITSQRTFLHFKKRNCYSRNRLDRWFIPQPSSEHLKTTSLPNGMIAVVALLNSRLGTRPFIRSMLRRMPDRLLDMYVSTLYRYYARIVREDFGGIS